MAKYLDPKVQIARPYAGQRRVSRRPKFPFNVQHQPFVIQPFMIAPVLPGETLKSAVFQSRAVTDPIKHPLIGWWLEHYWFYVSWKDMEYHLDPTMVSKPFETMVLNPSASLASMYDSVEEKLYHAYGVNWTRLAMETAVEWYFRDQDESWNVATLDDLPLAQITGNSWMDSLTHEDDVRDDRRVDLDLDGDGTIQADEIDDAQALYQAGRDAGLYDMDYEDYLKTYGVQVREVETSSNLYRPELLRYMREWSYPTNIVDPTTGVPSSAVSWAAAGRFDKNRYFKQPGFIIGMTCCRPKVYFSQQIGSASGIMDRQSRWLPAIRHHQYEEAFVALGHNEGPLPGIFEDESEDPKGYVFDLRDLLMYGDQFINHDPSAMDGALSCINPDGSKRYVSTDEIANLFKSSEATRIRQDGIVNLIVAGRQRDKTPGPTL